MWVGIATMRFFSHLHCVFLWPWGIGEADDDLKAIKGPFLTLHDIAELRQKLILRRQTYSQAGDPFCLAPGGLLCAP